MDPAQVVDVPCVVRAEIEYSDPPRIEFVGAVLANVDIESDHGYSGTNVGAPSRLYTNHMIPYRV